MCGIAGAFLSGLDSGRIDQAVRLMCQQMYARGPDDSGYWSDIDNGVTLGHRRLSIIDLSTRANQPMISDDGQHVIVFNGEIYNYRDLRSSLEAEGEVFRTESDTEVILKLYRNEGDSMLSRLRGMFAIAIWDRQSRRIFIARDPYGIKPLYIARCPHGWLFASQVKALLESNLVDRAPSPFGQMGFWLLGSVPEPYTWFDDITSLPAGTWRYLKENGTATLPRSYWDIADTWRAAPECNLGVNEVQEIVRAATSESVNKHLVSDVPVGIFLSGGIDSGALAGLMRDQGGASIEGITIAFNEFRGRHEDEVTGAREIAKRYGINHHVRTVTRSEFENDLPKILASMDQPSVDGINTWFASKAASELGLKVVISGVGGDELFYGYPSFQKLPNLVSRHRILARLPGMRSLADLMFAQKARSSKNPRWNWVTTLGGSLYGAYWLQRGLFSPEQLSELMGEFFTDEVFCKMNPETLITSLAGILPSDSMAAVGQIESMTYLRNQLLRDGDWASMAHSVELRSPLVDAWLLRDLMPVLRSFGTFKGKSLLAASPSLPLGISYVGRTKTGFGIPLGIWGGESVSTKTRAHERTPTQDGQDSRIWAKIIAKMTYQPA
jgi:asparagine synthase (glutamine-hydrolysing)